MAEHLRRMGYLGLTPVPIRKSFDWTGVTVGHWRVTGEAVRCLNHSIVYRCVSRCGATGAFERHILAKGAFPICEICDPAASYDRTTSVTKDYTATKAWEGPMIQERTTLKLKEATEEWENGGREVLNSVLVRSGLGTDFGWKVFIRDCHRHPNMQNSDRDPIKIRAFHDSTRRIELKIFGGTRYEYEVDLSTGRVDRPWIEIRRALEGAVSASRKKKSLPTEKPTPETPVAATEVPVPVPVPRSAAEAKAESTNAAIFGGLDTTKLAGIRDGLDSLIAFSKDVNAASTIKVECEASLADVMEKGRALKEERDAATKSLAQAQATLNLCQTNVAQLATKLKEAERLLAKATAESQEAADRRDKAVANYAPVELAIMEAEEALADAKRMEAERMQLLSKADDIAPLLAALQKFSTAGR